jgi:quercetin dioxygenase-like cupin family protein
MHHVTRFEGAPGGGGYRYVSHIDRSVGAIHTGMGTCELDPGATLAAHVHAFEEFVYVLEGNPLLAVDGVEVELVPDSCAFIAVGSTHSWRNPGASPARWIDFHSPQARGPGEPPDTFLVPDPGVIASGPLNVRDPRARHVALWHPAQMDVDAVRATAPVDAPEVSASMSSALLAYSGIAVKMLLDERHGATQGHVFMVDYEPVVVLHPHDHPVEEAFYMLEGEVVFFADDAEYVLREGDVAYAGVGCIHAFENRSGRRTRWLETRAPLPPLRHGYRFNRDWEYLASTARRRDGR